MGVFVNSTEALPPAGGFGQYQAYQSGERPFLRGLQPHSPDGGRKVKPCLHSNVEYALKGLDFAGMRGQLEKAIWNKPAWHGNLDAVHRSQAGRNMNQIGG